LGEDHVCTVLVTVVPERTPSDNMHEQLQIIVSKNRNFPFLFMKGKAAGFVEDGSECKVSDRLVKPVC
jgi:hypothetical protein